jgi:hypothetical protein
MPRAAQLMPSRRSLMNHYLRSVLLHRLRNRARKYAAAVSAARVADEVQKGFCV